MLALLGVIGLLSLLVYFSMTRRGTQGGGDASYSNMDHISFNVRRPTTEWLNMGDWTGTDDFVTANRQLALRLIEKAGVRAGEAILDVGCGCGDSLLLLLQEERFRPRLLHGVTSMPYHAERARVRVRDALSELGTAGNMEVNVFCQDAIQFCQEQQGKTTYDRILALDCVYHFVTRQEFLTKAKMVLKSDGTIALQDLIAAHPYPVTDQPFFTSSPSLPRPDIVTPSFGNTLKHLITLRLAGVPRTNMVSASRYYEDIQSLGLKCICFEDVSHAVFPGFSRFLQQIGKGSERAWRGGTFVQWYGLRSFGEVVEKWSRGGDNGMVRSVTVVLTKSDDTNT